jgi:hypothetical protein
LAQRGRTPRKPPEPRTGGPSCRATLAQLAGVFGIGHRTLVRYQMEGAFAPVVAARGRQPALYDALDVARVLINWPESARDSRDRAQAELLTLRLRRELGELVDRHEEDRRDYEMARTVRDQMQVIPDRISPQLAAETDAGRIHSLLAEEIRQTLLALSETLALKEDEISAQTEQTEAKGSKRAVGGRGRAARRSLPRGHGGGRGR